MELSQILTSVTKTRKKLSETRRKSVNSLESSRRKYFSELDSFVAEEIPKNSYELLMRYGTSRGKVQSYKLDAAELLILILHKPIKRYFFALLTIDTPVKNTKKQPILNHKLPRPRPSFDKENCPRIALKKKVKNQNVLTEFKRFDSVSNLEKTLKKIVKKSEIFAFSALLKNLQNKQFADLFGKVCEKIGKKMFFQMKFAFRLVRSMKNNRVVPRLKLTNRFGLEKCPISENSMKNFMKKMLNSRILQENSCSMKKFSLLTDRRGEKYNSSNMPSSIYCESENSITDRADFANRKLKNSMEMKDFESFFDFESTLDGRPHKNDSKKGFFQESAKKVNGNEEKREKTFVFDESFLGLKKEIKAKKSFQKILGRKLRMYYREIIENSEKQLKIGKIMELIECNSGKLKETVFGKWKILRKFSLKSIKLVRILRKILEFTNARIKARIFKDLSAINSITPKETLVISPFHCKILLKFFVNLVKDANYRKRICFQYWKKDAKSSYTEKLKLISLKQNIENLLQMRKASVLNLLKILNKKFKASVPSQTVSLLKIRKKLKFQYENYLKFSIHQWMSFKSSKQLQTLKKKANKICSILSKIEKSKTHERFSEIKIFSLEDNSKKIHFTAKFFRIIQNLTKKLWKKSVLQTYSHMISHSFHSEIQKKCLKKILRSQMLTSKMYLKNAFFYWKLFTKKSIFN